MLRLMIADDEDEERCGIQFLLRRYGFFFEVEEAADGREALKRLKERPADILLTDVEMPFLNGIDLAMEARRLFDNIQIIFFSGYDDFEYVRRALSLQAVDYILKPVNSAEFQKTLSLVVERIAGEEEETSANQFFRHSYILSRLLNQVPFEKLAGEYEAGKLTFLRDYERLILMEFDEDFFGREAVDIRDFCERLRRGGAVLCEFDFLDLTPSDGVLFLKNMRQRKGEAREIARCIHLLVEKEYGCSCCLAVSPEIGGPEEIGGAYRTAEESLEERFFYQEVFVYPLEEEKKSKTVAVDNENQALQKIARDVACRDFYGLKRDMSILLEQCRSNRFQSYIYTRFVCANLLQALFSGMPEEAKGLVGRLEKVYACSHFADLEAILWEAVAELEECLLTETDSTGRAAVLVEKYVREHYGEPLSLDILADKVYLTARYLSSVFIEEKGIGLNKYIKNVRMEKARELLRETNMKVNEISEKVGYANLSYFCRSFRNEYGVTPDQYRRKQGG